MDYVQRSTFGKVFVILEHRDGGLNEWGRIVSHFDSYHKKTTKSLPYTLSLHPKISHSSEHVNFILTWHIHPKMSHSSKNGTFIQKWRTHP